MVVERCYLMSENEKEYEKNEKISPSTRLVSLTSTGRSGAVYYLLMNISKNDDKLSHVNVLDRHRFTQRWLISFAVFHMRCFLTTGKIDKNHLYSFSFGKMCKLCLTFIRSRGNLLTILMSIRASFEKMYTYNYSTLCF